MKSCRLGYCAMNGVHYCGGKQDRCPCCNREFGNTSRPLNYGIHGYNQEQLEFSKDIMKVLKSKKHLNISADDCFIVFGRIYAMYVASQLMEEGKIKMVGK